MSLATRRNGNVTWFVLTECPACGFWFGGADSTVRRDKHIAEHDPEDFGLSPLGEIPEDHAKPLFGGVSDAE